jgi:hypothetical protein
MCDNFHQWHTLVESPFPRWTRSGWTCGECNECRNWHKYEGFPETSRTTATGWISRPFLVNGKRYRSVSIVTRLQFVRQEFHSLQGRDSVSVIMSRPTLGPTQPPAQWIPGFFPLQSGRGVKLTTHLSCTSYVKNAWSCTSTPPYAYMLLCLLKQQGQLYRNFPSECRSDLLSRPRYISAPLLSVPYIQMLFDSYSWDSFYK